MRLNLFYLTNTTWARMRLTDKGHEIQAPNCEGICIVILALLANLYKVGFWRPKKDCWGYP